MQRLVISMIVTTPATAAQLQAALMAAAEAEGAAVQSVRIRPNQDPLARYDAPRLGQRLQATVTAGGLQRCGINPLPQTAKPAFVPPGQGHADER